MLMINPNDDGQNPTFEFIVHSGWGSSQTAKISTW